MEKNININFPFRDSKKGYFVDLTTTDAKAIKADLIHLLLTNKGERLYLPEFGANLRKYLFNPYDEITKQDIRDEIDEAVKTYIPNLVVTKLEIDQSTRSEYGVVVRLDYVVTTDVYESADFVIINL